MRKSCFIAVIVRPHVLLYRFFLSPRLLPFRPTGHGLSWRSLPQEKHRQQRGDAWPARSLRSERDRFDNGSGSRVRYLLSRAVFSN